ncbi:hypothetical protein KP509_20G079400 [Ceratopteris richardii]|uniref:Uncharacterized protein n=1 Tax=Ceratopteris richardii TaxID=49495 RepID=A0A8T2SJS1_CERRI|nr:hypothetical protein KP509_20G079400 [Ceratopteris richardii]
MSEEDSIASDSISCRTAEACAPLLPPRKRLLAGFKQNGWSSVSSSLSIAASVEPSQSLNCAAESVASESESCREPNSQIVSSHPTTKKSKKKKKLASEAGEHQSEVSADSKVSSDAGKTKATSGLTKASRGLYNPPVKVVDEADADLLVAKISSVVEDYSIVSDEACIHVDENDQKALTPSAEASREHYPASGVRGSNLCSVINDEEEDMCDGAHKASTKSATKFGKGKMNKSTKGKLNTSTATKASKSRKNSMRDDNKSKESLQKKQDVWHESNFQVVESLSDEELARQLHRAMNSSPRISRCLSHKDERPLSLSGRKNFPGS